MTKSFAEFLILTAYIVLAVLLYSSTANYPPSVQGSTAMYVRFLGTALGVLCTLELLLWFKNRHQASGEKLNMTSAPLKFWGLLLMLVLYAVALSFGGFYLSSAVFLPVTMVLLGARRPLSIGLTSLGVLLFVYLVFAKLLEVPLPEGSLF